MISAAISLERLDHLALAGQAHLRPIYSAMRTAGVSLFMVPQGRERFHAPRVRSFVALVADDTDRAEGPQGFHRKSLRRLAQDAKCIALISSDVVPSVYTTAAQIAALGANVLICETRCEQEGAWLDFLKAAAPPRQPLDLHGRGGDGMNATAAILEADAAVSEAAGRQAPHPHVGEARIRQDLAACARLPFRDVRRFAEQGVSAPKLLGFRVDPGEIGETAFRRAYPGMPPIDLDFEVRRARVQFLRSGRIVFATDKQADPEAVVPAFVMPAFDADGVMIDLVAWHPPTDRLGSSERAAGWLAGGYHSEDEPLVVHPNPLAWLRANRQGVVIVHEDIARPALLAQRTLQAADVAHGEALQAMLSKVRVPRIVVPASVGRIAA